ncbi:substrate-binding domain-containing protein [Streptomyces sp. NPDC001797]|uniref:substrate-binding domain-containing protein n=1 Tax=Streptomyces sp. NPDC001797 TaxID=3364610 RepID=UPI00368EAABD
MPQVQVVKCGPGDAVIGGDGGGEGGAGALQPQQQGQLDRGGAGEGGGVGDGGAEHELGGAAAGDDHPGGLVERRERLGHQQPDPVRGGPGAGDRTVGELAVAGDPLSYELAGIPWPLAFRLRPAPRTVKVPSAYDVLHAVAEAAHEAGLEVIVSAGPARTRAGRPERGWLDELTARGSSGVLFDLAESTEAQYTWADHHRIPYVLIDPVHEPPAGVVSVGAANWQGGVTATEHLLALGHERIAVIAGNRRRMCCGARVSGYRSALASAGLRPRGEYVRHAGLDEDTARHRMHELLDLPGPPTAVFVCSDRMALGVYAALAERGPRVPYDVSVVGFGDLPEARWGAQALTTVRRPLAEMAATALRLLVRMVHGDRPEGTRTELLTRLVERASTAAPAARSAVRR